MKTEVKRIKMQETDTGYKVIEVIDGKETVLQDFPIAFPTFPKGATVKEKTDLVIQANADAWNFAMSFLRSDLFLQYNEMQGFEKFTPQLVSETEFVVYEAVEE